MAHPNRIAPVLIIAAAVGIATAARADLQAGKQAYQRGDYDLAREELLPLAEAGNAAAQVYMGLMHATGKGVDKDTQAAARWYGEAAAQGHPDGEFNLGLMHAKGQGVPLDYGAAVRLYSQAAEQGHAGAQLNLGVCYARGYGVLRNEATAAHWFREAAEQNNAAAQFNLGLAYATGNGAKSDPEQAVDWYTKAAEQGYTPAQLNLGVCYERGLGVPRDPRAAAKWYRLAAASGNKAAQDNLKRVVAALDEPPADEPAAVAIEEDLAPVVVESGLPSGEGEPMPDSDEPVVANAPAEHVGSSVGKIVTRADSVVGEVDTVVATVGDSPLPAADAGASDSETAAAEDNQAADLPRAMGVSGVSQASQTDEMTLAWRNRGSLSPPSAARQAGAELQEVPVP